MPDYSKTVIYKIEVGGKNYYGHTTVPLRQRESKHKCDFKRGRTSQLYNTLRKLGMCADDVQCVLVEECPCECVQEARARERYWIEQHGELNTYIPNRSPKEYRATHHERLKIQKANYYMDNRDNILKKQTIYAATNNREISEYQASYYQSNKERIQKYNTEYRCKNKDRLTAYREANRSTINERACEKVACSVCGKHVIRANMSRHVKRKHSSPQE